MLWIRMSCAPNPLRSLILVAELRGLFLRTPLSPHPSPPTPDLTGYMHSLLPLLPFLVSVLFYRYCTLPQSMVARQRTPWRRLPHFGASRFCRLVTTTSALTVKLFSEHSRIHNHGFPLGYQDSMATNGLNSLMPCLLLPKRGLMIIGPSKYGPVRQRKREAVSCLHLSSRKTFEFSKSIINSR